MQGLTCALAYRQGFTFPLASIKAVLETIAAVGRVPVAGGSFPPSQSSGRHRLSQMLGCKIHISLLEKHNLNDTLRQIKGSA